MQKVSIALLSAILIAGCAQTTQDQQPPSLPEMPIESQNEDSSAADPYSSPSPTSKETQEVEVAPETQEVEVSPETQAIEPQATPEATTNQDTQQTTQVQETTTQAPTEETKQINLQSSLVEWLGEKIVGASHPGSFNLQSGQISLVDNKIKSGSFVIDINSLKSYQAISALEKHLLSDDFFNAASFPTGKFETTNVSYSSPTQLTITGNLTLKGKTNTETFQATQDLSSNTITAKLNLDRTKYDIIFGSGKFFKELADAAIKDIIPLDITLKY